MLRLASPGRHWTPNRLDISSYSSWKPTDNGQGSGRVWLANLVMGYGHGGGSHKPEPVPFPGVPRILVLDDAGFMFRHEASRTCWQLPAAGEPAPDWIITKMSSPLAEGDLWEELADRFFDRLVCVVSAAQLRRESVGIREGLSWESTVEDLRDGLRSHSTLNALTECRHLVVTFSTDGALWLDRTDSLNPRATLVCDMGGAEGEWSQRFKGTAFRYHSCMVAAIARTLALHSNGNYRTATGGPALSPAIAAGLVAMRDLARSGHGPVRKTPPAGFPATDCKRDRRPRRRVLRSADRLAERGRSTDRQTRHVDDRRELPAPTERKVAPVAHRAGAPGGVAGNGSASASSSCDIR